MALVDLHLDCEVLYVHSLKLQCFTKFSGYLQSGKEGHTCASDMQHVGALMADS